MRKDVYSFFNIEKTEKSSVLLFLIQSIFLGVFYGAFDVGAHALFLSVYPASMIPKAYVLSGIVGIILTTIYARVQSKYKFSTLAIFNLVFISISVAILWLLFQFTERSWLIFLIFMMMGPLNIIALLSFWGAVGRIFTLRQGKRLFGLIDSGQIFGAILSTFAIPILISVGFQQKNLLLLSSISVGCALAIQFIISFKFNLNIKIQSTTKKRNRLPELLKNKYILHMSIFVVMSMLAAFFIQFAFLTVTKDNYPDHNDLTEFLGAFTGSLLLFTFLFKTFVYSKLMKAYGLKVSIIISSFLLSIFTIIAIIIGSLSGYTSASSSFIFFFLIISLSRLFSKALKDAVEVPSFKILYQSLKVEIRHDVQAYVDGTINEIAALSAGLILAALSMFEFFKLIHFSYSLMIILIIWFFVARKLYLEYKISLQKSLAEYKGEHQEVEDLSDFIDENLTIENELQEDPKIIAGLDMFYQLNPMKFENKIEHLADLSGGKLNSFTENIIYESKILDFYSLINKEGISTEKTENIPNVFKRLELKLEKTPGAEKLIEMSKSKSTDDRILAAFLIGKFYESSLFTSLKSLMRDLYLPVKIAAIKAASKTKNTDFCPLIADYIDNPELMSFVYGSLLSYGEQALDSIDQVFYKTGTNHRTLLRIVKLIGQIGGNKSINKLIKKLDHPNEEILNAVLVALQGAKFKANETEIIRINQIIEKHIGVIAWNIAAKTTLNETVKFSYLKDALNDELTANYNLLYLLLSLAYDAKSIMHVKENIESGTSEGVSYALELLDLFISEDIKPKLFPIVEDISDIEKIRQLQNFYPIEKLPMDDLLIAFVNRDINNTNIWKKACALYSFSETENNIVPDDLIAHLFNPYDILRETAAVVVNEIDNKKFLTIEERLRYLNYDNLGATTDLMAYNKYELLVEKTWYLKSLEFFKSVDGKYLYELSKLLNVLIINDSIGNVFLSDIKNKLLFVKGEPSTILINNAELNIKEGEIYDMDEILVNAKNEIYFKVNEGSIIFHIDKKEIIYNMFDFHQIECAILKWLKTNLKKEQVI